jgi:hypothetical protein
MGFARALSILRGARGTSPKPVKVKETAKEQYASPTIPKRCVARDQTSTIAEASRRAMKLARLGGAMIGLDRYMPKSFTARRRARWLFVFLTLLLSLNSGEGRAQEQAFDRERYYRAVEYCRRYAWPGPMNLSPDRQVLCFSGTISQNMDVSLAKDLEQDGLFVVRSPGGYPGPAITLSNLIRDRHATVVVYDFCFSACAEYFLIASYQTYVLKGTLVAWHRPRSSDPNQPYCSFLAMPRDGGPKKLLWGPCGNSTFGDQAAYSAHSWPVVAQFFKERTVDPSFETPPDSLYVRRIVSNLYAETGIYRDIGWTIHPRYYPRWFKSKIFYEAYPESQDEVDGILARLHLNFRVIYDP